MESSARLVGDYELGPRLGSGTFAVVWLAKHRSSGLEVAVKEINMNLLSPKVTDNLLKEISILRTIDHPNIIRLYETIETGDSIFLVLEYCSGGDLAGYITRHGRVPESVAKHFMRQLALGLRVLHEKHFIHRDLKPQNLLLSSKEVTPSLKIGDFGFARSVTPESMAQTFCGSPLYMAPEIIQHHKYDGKADLWSAGAILFQLVTGKPPFDGLNHIQLFQNILGDTELKFPKEALKAIHPDCVDLCRSLLRRNPIERLSFHEFFNHVFLREPRQMPDSTTSMRKSTLPSSQPSRPTRFKPVAENIYKHGSSSSAENISSEKTKKETEGQCSSNKSKVADSVQLVEREYVLVNNPAALLEASDRFDASLQDYRFPSVLPTIDEDSSSSLRPSDMSVLVDALRQVDMSVVVEAQRPVSDMSVLVDAQRPVSDMSGSLEAQRPVSDMSGSLEAQRPVSDVSGSLEAQRPVSDMSGLRPAIGSSLLTEVQRLTIVHPPTKLQLLHQYALALTEVASEMGNAGQVKENFAVMLVVLAMWTKALEICDSWMISVGEDRVKPPDPTTAPETSIPDLNAPATAKTWVTQQFVTACNQAENSSTLVTSDASPMPDAMETIYEKALAYGRSGGAEELLGNKESATTFYKKAILLFSFIVEDAVTLSLNPPFSLTPNDKKRIRYYISSIQHRLSQL